MSESVTMAMGGDVIDTPYCSWCDRSGGGVDRVVSLRVEAAWCVLHVTLLFCVVLCCDWGVISLCEWPVLDQSLDGA